MKNKIKPNIRNFIIFLSVIIFAFSIINVIAISKKASPDSKDSKAWLADVQIREDSAKLEKIEPTPTVNLNKIAFDKMKMQADSTIKLVDPNLQSIEQSYTNMIKKVFDKLDIKDYSTPEEKKTYLSKEQHVNFNSPSKEDNKDAYVDLLYYVLKYDLSYPVSGKHFKIQKNRTPKEGVFDLVKEVYGDKNDAEIDNLKDFAINDIKKTLTKNNIETEDKSPEELMELYKATLAQKMGVIPKNTDITKLSKEEIDLSYAKGIIDKSFKTKLDNKSLSKVLESKNSDALLAEILKNQISSKGKKPISDVDVEKLYNQAVEMDLFDVKDEFYSDVYSYNVNLKHKVQAIWFTPFTRLAEIPNEDMKNLKIEINSTPVKHGGSVKIESKDFNKPILVKLEYRNAEKVIEKKSYKFKIINGSKSLDTNEIPLNESLPSINYGIDDAKINSESFLSQSLYDPTGNLNSNLAKFQTSAFLPYTIDEPNNLITEQIENDGIILASADANGNQAPTVTKKKIQYDQKTKFMIVAICSLVTGLVIYLQKLILNKIKNK